MNFLSTEAAEAFIVNNQPVGRKFEITDLTPALESAARTVALAWVAPSAGHWAINFMTDMRLRAGSKKGLSIGQAKGVLNVVRAEAKPKAVANPTLPVAGANVSKVRTARFRVVAADGNSIALRISVPTMWTDAPKGTRKLSVRTYEGWSTVGKIDPNGAVNIFKKVDDTLKYRTLDALETLQNADDDLVYILAYAMEGSECGFCGLELDTVESLTVGYGPTCAKKHDLPWGAKAVPAKVLLAKEGLVPSEVEAPKSAKTYEEIFPETPAAPAAPSVTDLKAALDAAKKAFALADGDDEDAAFEAVVAAKKALAVAFEAAASKADYDLQTDTDGAVITGAGIVLRPWNDEADDLAAAADLANDMAAGN
jgi:hypothetical protein